MEEEIGKTAGAIWGVLNTKGKLSLSELKKTLEGQKPTFDWAIGARKPDCDYAREGRFSNPLETRGGKGDGRLVG